MDLFHFTNGSCSIQTPLPVATQDLHGAPLTKDAGTKVEPGRLYDLMTNAPDEVDSLQRQPWSIKKILSGFSTTSQKKI